MAAKKAKAPPKEVDPAEAAVHESLRRAQQVWSSGLGTTLGILKEADKNLSERLHSYVQKNGGPTGKFSEANAQVYRKQIGLVTEYLEKRLAGHTHAQTMKALKVSVADTVTLAKTFEHKFTGITRPLALESQQMQDALVRGSGASLLQRHQTSWNRYGKAMVGDFERVLRTAQLEGLTHHQTVSRLVRAGELGGHSAASLHAHEPGYFPEPSGYVKRRYWAERIVRTENAHALGAGALQSMNVLREKEFPDLCKKILAKFDNRTAPDSVAVHGQVRKLEEMFMDGAGRQYLHPPGRPNDRETVIPWRPHWEATPSTQAAPAEVVAQAQVEAQPTAVGEKRKGDLKAALQKAKAKILAQKAEAKVATEQAQAYSLAQAKAQAAQVEGQKALGAVVLQDAAALAAAAEKIKQALVPGAKFNAAKAKAQEYLVQKKAIAEAKVAAARAEAQAKLEATATSVLDVFKKPGTFSSGVEVLTTLKETAKSDPKMFGEMWRQMTGKAASSVQGLKPMALGKAVKTLAKKIQPDLKYPEPKKKVPKLTPEQLLAQKKAALLAHDANLPEAAAAFTPEEIHELVKGNPLVLPGEVSEVLTMSKQGKAAYLHQVVKDWEELKFEAGKAEIKPQPSGGVIYLDVYQGGKKTAYYFQEGTADAPEYVVKPPTSLGATHPTLKFASKVEATAYSIEVGNKLAEDKLQTAKSKQAEQLLAAQKAKPAPPPAAVWSEKWEAPVRPVAELALSPAQDVAKHLKPNRQGHSVSLDEDYIENFDVAFHLEKVNGHQETVVRFKVTEHRGKNVLAALENAGAKAVDYGYRRLQSLDAQELEYSSDKARAPQGVKGVGLTHDGVSITMLRSTGRGEEVGAGHNLIEMRFRAPIKEAMAKAEQGFELLGIGTKRPTDKQLKAYKRAKIMAYVDSDAAGELRKLGNRSGKAFDAMWDRAVVRNPKLAQIEADAELRQVGPGKHALYSPTVAKMFEEAGVKWVSHDSSSGVEALEQILVQDKESGLLSSRERWQRGLFFDGQSSGRDFETGGADSVFTRLKNEPIQKVYDHRWTVEIDTSELGRLDSYFFNGDRYGKAGPSDDRKTVDQITNLVRTDRLSESNELMLQRQVPQSSIRRVVLRDAADRTALLEKLKKQGREEINGVPIEDFLVHGYRVRHY